MSNYTHFTMAQAKRDFHLGLLTKFGMERAMGEWLVVLFGPTMNGSLVDARSKAPRSFKTLDAAVSAIEAIGFRVDGLSMA